MSADPCPAEVEVTIAHGADEGAAIECDRDAGHEPPHRAEFTERVLTPPNVWPQTALDAAVVITWETP